MNILVTALKADLELVTKPLNSAQNFVRKLKGEEPREFSEDTSKVRRMLDEKVEERKREKENSKKSFKITDLVFKRRRLREALNNENYFEERENEFAEK